MTRTKSIAFQGMKTTRAIAKIIASGTLALIVTANPVFRLSVMDVSIGVTANASTTPGASTMVDAGNVKARISVSGAHPTGGQTLAVLVEFSVAPGWHIYGKPVPEDYTPTSVTFDDELIASQSINMPPPKPVKFEILNDTLPVYQGNFKASGDVQLKPKLTPGEHQLAGTLSFQECNDNLCKMPQQVHFELPLQISASAK